MRGFHDRRIAAMQAMRETDPKKIATGLLSVSTAADVACAQSRGKREQSTACSPGGSAASH